MRLPGNTRQARYVRYRFGTAHPAARSSARGFTLIELLVTLAVAVVLIAVAVPSFTNIINSNRLTTAANDLVAAIQTARVEAVRRNSPTQVCSNKASGKNDVLDQGCTAAGNPPGAVYGLVNPTTNILIQKATPNLGDSMKLVGDMATLRFGSDGVGRATDGTIVSGDVVTLCTDAISNDNRRVISIATGSILSVTKTSGACP